MNSKLISYEEAVEQLKELEVEQRFNRKYRKVTVLSVRSRWQTDRDKNTKKINILLSIITAHKQARRMYGILRDVQDKLGLSTKERKLVDGVLNEKK